MLRARAIPCLLLDNRKLVKTIRFRNPTYVGDPINAVKIFSEKECDEIIVLDIGASPARREPEFECIRQIADQCFMPLCYGGGVSSLAHIERLLALGVEKVAMNTAAVNNPGLLESAAKEFGSSTIVAALDVKLDGKGQYEVFVQGGRVRAGFEATEAAYEMERRGAGELLINSIDRDGTMSGFDQELITKIVDAVAVPVVACGGAGSLGDLSEIMRRGGASGAAAGSLFVFQGKHRAVLISYPSPEELNRQLC